MKEVILVLSTLISISVLAGEKFEVSSVDSGYEKTIDLTLKIDGREYISGTNTVLVRNIRFEANSPYNDNVTEFRLDYSSKTLQNVCSFLGHGNIHTPPRIDQSGIDSILEINDSKEIEKLKYQQIAPGVTEFPTFSDVECTLK